MRRALPILIAAVVCAAPTQPVSGAPSPYAGTYITTRPGAGSTQELLLILAPNGAATLTTGFPDLVRRYGPGVMPVRETGTWRARHREVEVRLTAIGLVPRDGRIRPKHEDKVIVFTLMRCRLSAVRYPKELYGEAGLTFEKSGCTE
jgi:hypothetical protein